MTDPLICFREIPWAEIAPGAREKRVIRGAQVLRLIEFAPTFREIQWCTKQHLGFVIEGEFAIEFTNGLIRFCQGDGIAIPAGEAAEHRAVVDSSVTLFLVETTSTPQS